jgi:hypothetical protein
MRSCIIALVGFLKCKGRPKYLQGKGGQGKVLRGEEAQVYVVTFDGIEFYFAQVCFETTNLCKDINNVIDNLQLLLIWPYEDCIIVCIQRNHENFTTFSKFT